YDRFNLPLSVAGLTDNSQVPVADMTAYEFRQLREQLPGNLAAYPPLPLNYDLPDLRGMLEALVESRHEGVVVSAVDFADVSRMNVVREVMTGA
ncbi:MAG: hypothetical protein HY318_07030, partial [Armatimonadetes bacterium]|nr:hypothetical protein [Armatimonadota bacterium]